MERSRKFRFWKWWAELLMITREPFALSAGIRESEYMNGLFVAWVQLGRCFFSFGLYLRE